MANRNLRVLLIEDDPVASGLFQAQIASDFTSRFETVVADTLGKALDEIARDRFDVAALDLILPDARGLDALDRLRQAAEDLPVVVLTGLDDE
ncbi:MAG: response regulator [Thermoanaerobaculia bacterium]|nr:response regulator [Thermoanaerobaculia bacterium]